MEENISILVWSGMPSAMDENRPCACAPAIIHVTRICAPCMTSATSVLDPGCAALSAVTALAVNSRSCSWEYRLPWRLSAPRTIGGDWFLGGGMAGCGKAFLTRRLAVARRLRAILSALSFAPDTSFQGPRLPRGRRHKAMLRLNISIGINILAAGFDGRTTHHIPFPGRC